MWRYETFHDQEQTASAPQATDDSSISVDVANLLLLNSLVEKVEVRGVFMDRIGHDRMADLVGWAFLIQLLR